MGGNNKRTEERKRSIERERTSSHFNSKHDDGFKPGGHQTSVAMHIVKSPAPTIHVQSPLSTGLGQLSPLSDSLLDEGLLMKWTVWLKTTVFKFSVISATIIM